MYYNPLKKKKIDVVVSRTSSYSLLASLLLSLNKKIKIMTYKEANNISIKDYLNSLGIQPRKREATGCTAAPYGRTTRQVSRWIITPIYGVTTELVRAGRSSTL